ncbi:alaserpin-like [Prorops nasuta]|uniref:alaserpin-like n=1 Tax=Prorops nasuta TaxID=863751 RepID=UPI0034CE903E
MDSHSTVSVAMQSVNKFTINFFQEVAQKSNENLATSPLSAHVALTMTSFGASGNTASQINNVLALETDDDLLKSSYKNFLEGLKNFKDVDLSLANKIYTKNGFFIKSDFKDTTENIFMSTTENIEFAKADAAAKKINQWAAAHTQNRINEIVKPDEFSPLTTLVLLNAVYFKGNWATQFNPDNTTSLQFKLNSQDTKNIPTMYKNDNIKFGILPELKASFVELPYKDNKFSMLIILPDEIEGLAEVENKLTNADLDYLATNGVVQKVELYLPKFTIESTLDLVKPLKKLGMTDMFDNSLADFSKMTDECLYVSNVVQKAFIQVNEEGCEAAAITAVRIVKRSLPPPPITFKVDRPFIFMINYLNIPIFTGHVKQF